MSAASEPVASTPARSAGWLPAAVAGSLALGAFLVATCDGNADRVAPEPPEVGPDEPWALVRPVSVINVPLGIPLSRLLDLVEEAVPGTHGDLETLGPPDGGRARAAYEFERSPFRATLVGDTARLSATVFYRVRVQYALPALPDIQTSCGMGDDPRPRLLVTLESPMSIGADWTLRTRARIAELRPASDEESDRCEVTAFGVDITDNVVRGATEYLEEHLVQIDSLIAQVDTRSRFESWWRTLREPVSLGDSVWLAMRPEAIRRGPLRGSGDSVTVQLALEARPEIVLGGRPTGRPTPLPPLDSGSVAPRLELLVDARADYSTASRLVTELLAGRAFDMSGRTFSIDELRIFGIGSGKLAMEVLVSGDLRGRLYLTGRPAIDSETGQVSIPDLDLDVATRDLLVATVTWFAAGPFREAMRTRATWRTTPAVDLLEGWLDEGLNRELSSDLRVAGTVDRVEIVGVAAFRNALLVRVSARGAARMFVQDSQAPD